MPVLQWGMLCVLSLLLSIGFLAVHLPAALLLGPMIAGIIFSMRGITLQLPRSAFLAAQAILGCMIAQNLTGSILTTLAVNWPIVLAILLVTLLSSAIVGWLLVRYSSLPGNTGAWGSSPGGAAAMVAMAQDYGADIRLVAFMQYLRVLFVAGAAVLVTRMMLGDNAEAVNQHIVWFPPVSINLLLTICSRSLPVQWDACCVFLPARCSSRCWRAQCSSLVSSSPSNYRNGCWRWRIWQLAGGLVLVSINKSYCGHYARYRKSCCRFCSAGYLCGYGVGADPVYAH